MVKSLNVRSLEIEVLPSLEGLLFSNSLSASSIDLMSPNPYLESLSIQSVAKDLDLSCLVKFSNLVSLDLVTRLGEGIFYLYEQEDARCSDLAFVASLPFLMHLRLTLPVTSDTKNLAFLTRRTFQALSLVADEALELPDLSHVRALDISRTKVNRGPDLIIKTLKPHEANLEFKPLEFKLLEFEEPDFSGLSTQENAQGSKEGSPEGK